VDVSQSWSGTSRWNSPYITGSSSVCFPSTADSCIAVGAYVVNFGFFDKIGALCNYSSRGYNITGKLGVDITAPGHTTFTTEKNLGYMTFSGTSSAAPHVVGTAALMLQYDKSLTHSQIRSILQQTAVKDKFTGAVPNPDWGYGKLNKEKAIRFLIENFK
jgi:subtilisin family serine protease